jgi:hypothetical protein
LTLTRPLVLKLKLTLIVTLKLTLTLTSMILILTLTRNHTTPQHSTAPDTPHTTPKHILGANNHIKKTTIEEKYKHDN